MSERRAGLLLLAFAASPALFAQVPTASRRADAQVGAGYSLGSPDYNPQTFNGFSAYAGLDLRPHFGVEFDLHQIGTSANGGSSQRTYEIGARYLRSYGSLVSYVRGMYGRGEFTYPYRVSALSYNLFSAAAGADIKAGEYLRVRLDYEYQTWMSFPNGGLHPQIVTFGVAYHFAGKPRYE